MFMLLGTALTNESVPRPVMTKVPAPVMLAVLTKPNAFDTTTLPSRSSVLTAMFKSATVLEIWPSLVTVSTAGAAASLMSMMP